MKMMTTTSMTDMLAYLYSVQFSLIFPIDVTRAFVFSNFTNKCSVNTIKLNSKSRRICK